MIEQVPPECRKPDRSGRSCIQALANGWIGCSDLCPVCTARFMAALGGLGETLDWHPAFVQRAEQDAIKAGHQKKEGEDRG